MTAANNRNTILWFSIVTLLVTAGCSGRPSPSPTGNASGEPPRSYRTPAADRPPASLLEVADLATDLFDAAGWSDWHRADAGLQLLNEAASELGVDLPKPELVAQLQANVVSVTEGTNTRQRIKAMAAANAITQIVAELSAQYEPAVPYDVNMLGYYGRQIELGVASGRSMDSTQAVADLVTVWDRAQPAIVRRGYARDARRFSDIVVELMSAKHPDDFAAPVRAELAAASRLERIFTSPQ
jgi:hypothetical protein